MNILITGAGRGLGFALGVEALQRGHTVLAGVRDPVNKLRGEMCRLMEAYPQNVQAIQLHVDNEDSVAQAARLMGEANTQIPLNALKLDELMGYCNESYFV